MVKKNYNVKYIGFFTVRFNNKAHDGFLTVLKKIGYTLITKPLKIIKDIHSKNGHIRKANFDVEIAVEAIKRKDSFDVCMLFSGDSDFHYLIKELKRNSKKVVVVSLKYHVSKELVESSDYYIDLSRLKDVLKRTE